MHTSDFISSSEDYKISQKNGSVAWQSPSNIAIIKYWGKHRNQLPKNPSLSITLAKAYTETTISYQIDKKRHGLNLEFLFDGQEHLPFTKRIERYMVQLEKYFPFISHSHFKISSKNTFPHSSGIASSASSMSALALCLCSIENEIYPHNEIMNVSLFLRKASFVARLGSGSACRSIYPSFVLWGKSKFWQKSSDLYALGVDDYHDTFNDLRNDILIISTSEKSVSSSQGHQLMKTNPFAQKRYQQADRRIGELQSILRNGDVMEFGTILESEALTLHALMMCSDPSYLLLEPNTIEAINKIRQFREDTGIPIFFSLDAGPNVHIVSFANDRNKIKSFLEEISGLSQHESIISDSIGSGPIKLLSSN